MTKESVRETLGLVELPLNWYYGAGRKERGITIVTYSPLLGSYGDGEVGRQMQQWTHYTGNPISGRSSAERKQRAKEALRQAEVYVTEVTGFSPREIIDKAGQLQEEYHGKDSAPFPFELF